MPSGPSATESGFHHAVGNPLFANVSQDAPKLGHRPALGRSSLIRGADTHLVANVDSAQATDRKTGLIRKLHRPASPGDAGLNPMQFRHGGDDTLHGQTLIP